MIRVASLPPAFKPRFLTRFAHSASPICPTSNSLVTGLGVDVCCTYFFIYKLEMGTQGAALAQIVVKVARLLVWACLMFYFGLRRTMFVTPKESTETLWSWKETRIYRKLAIPNLLYFLSGWYVVLMKGNGEDGGEEGLRGEIVCKTVRSTKKLPTTRRRVSISSHHARCLTPPHQPPSSLLLGSSRRFIFELQIIALAHISGINAAALAAGAVWVQVRGT